MGLGHVARPIRLDGQQVALGPTAADKKQSRLFAIDRAGAEFLRRSVDNPITRAIVRVDAGHFLIAAENHLGLAGQGANQRRAVAQGGLVQR